jgi:hypothetical protein
MMWGMQVVLLHQLWSTDGQKVAQVFKTPRDAPRGQRSFQYTVEVSNPSGQGGYMINVDTGDLDVAKEEAVKTARDAGWRL